MKKKNLLAMSMFAAAMTSTTAFAAAAPAASSGVDSFIDGLDKSFAVTTNYVFRGLSQAEGLPAVQGGVTYNHASGLSVDFWMSSSAGTAGGLSDEYDVTVSYSGKADNISYEAGIASYNYPQVGTAVAAHEIFAGVSFNKINAYLYVNPKNDSGNNTYIELSTELTDRFTIELGLNSNDFVALDYNQITARVNLHKNLDYSISQTDLDGAKAEMALTYSMTF